jgi:hypothetical protein
MNISAAESQKEPSKNEEQVSTAENPEERQVVRLISSESVCLPINETGNDPMTSRAGLDSGY